MAYSETWDAAYEAVPAGTENVSDGDDRIRAFKGSIRERIEKDHYMAIAGTDADHGEHKRITFHEPIAKPTAVANKGFLYGKDVGAKIELHFEDEDGDEVQLTSAGKTIVSDGTVTAAKLTTNAVETLKIKDANVTAAKIGTGAVTNTKIGADAVDDTKIGDAKIKKEHINADVVGAGLAGGAGTALSVDGIVPTGGNEIKVKVINIGDWNMDATAYVDVAHGLTKANIRSIATVIRRDDDNELYPISYSGGGFVAGYDFVSTTIIRLVRVADRQFDNTAFDSTSFNRGYITIWYTA